MYEFLEYLAGGMTADQIVADVPSLEREDIRACLAFAAVSERRLASWRAVKFLFDENLSLRLAKDLEIETFISNPDESLLILEGGEEISRT